MSLDPFSTNWGTDWDRGAAPPRLTVELVPSTSHFRNLRSLLSPAEWGKVRRKIYRRAGFRCQVCGGRGPAHPVECHEEWHYNEDTQVQSLAALVALCPACHQAKHAGLAATRGRLPQVVGHLARVNDWTPDEAGQHLQAAFTEYRRRSQLAWVLDVSVLDEILKGEGNAPS